MLTEKEKDDITVGYAMILSCMAMLWVLGFIPGWPIAVVVCIYLFAVS